MPLSTLHILLEDSGEMRFRNWFAICLVCMYLPVIASVRLPLQGVKTIGLEGDFESFTPAINALNSAGVSSPGVTFLVAAGTYAENPPPLTCSGTVDAPISFMALNPADSPVLIPSGATNSFGFKLVAASHVTFSGISIAGGSNLSYGFWLEGGSSYNVIQACTITFSGSGASNRGIYSQAGTGHPNNANSFIDNAIDNVSTGIYVSSPSSTLSQDCVIRGNTLTNVFQAGIFHGFGTNTSIDENTISFAPASVSGFEGIRLNGSASTVLVSNNIIGNGFTTSSAYGIYVSNGSHRIFGNQIISLSANGSTHGIYLQNGGEIHVHSNRISGLGSEASSAASVNGVTLDSGTDCRIYNNMISDLKAPRASTIPQVRGLNIVGGTSIKIYYNSIFLAAVPHLTNSGFSTAALYLSSSSGSIDLRNNILINRSEAGTSASARAVSFWKSSNGFANLNSLSDCNIYYAGEPGPKNLICYNNTTSFQTLEAYLASNIGKDQGSFSGDIAFLSIVNPYDLHLNPSVPTLAEGNAIPIAGYDIDFDGDLRHLSGPDIGADEGDFTPLGAEIASPQINLYISDGMVHMSWTAVQGASCYKVFSSDNPGIWEPEPDAIICNTVYAVPLAPKRFFRVRAVAAAR